MYHLLFSNKSLTKNEESAVAIKSYCTKASCAFSMQTAGVSFEKCNISTDSRRVLWWWEMAREYNKKLHRYIIAVDEFSNEAKEILKYFQSLLFLSFSRAKFSDAKCKNFRSYISFIPTFLISPNIFECRINI